MTAIHGDVSQGNVAFGVHDRVPKHLIAKLDPRVGGKQLPLFTHPNTNPVFGDVARIQHVTERDRSGETPRTENAVPRRAIHRVGQARAGFRIFNGNQLRGTVEGEPHFDK